MHFVSVLVDDFLTNNSIQAYQVKFKFHQVSLCKNYSARRDPSGVLPSIATYLMCHLRVSAHVQCLNSGHVIMPMKKCQLLMKDVEKRFLLSAEFNP